MKALLALALLLILSSPAHAVPGTTRESPMGDRSRFFDKILYQNAAGTVKFEYYLLGPAQMDKNAKYPLIVVLHGRSGHAYGAYVLADQVLNQGMPAFVVVPVVGPKVDDWTADLFKDADASLPKPIDHVAAMTRNLAAKLPIDQSRIYVTGYSMGGVGTFGALYYYPELFTAGIPICGAWYPQDAQKFVGKPIWAFHGEADSIAPVKQTTDMIQAIRKAGGSPHLTLYPNVNHNSWINAYAEPELWTWLFAQTSKATPPAKPEKTLSVIKKAEPAGTKARKMPE